MNKHFLKKSVTAALVAGGLMGLGVQPAYAAANLLKAVKVGGGWVSVVSYINTQPVAGGGVYIHATHQTKNPANFTDACKHLDGRSTTTQNDLTTSVLSTPGGGLGSVYPVTDSAGGAILNPGAGTTPAEGFLVLENYDGTAAGGGAGGLGADGTLTSEAIVFNLASGYLYSERALTVTHNLSSPGGNVSIEAPGCGNCNFMQATPFSAGGASVFGNGTAGATTRFMFLPAATAATGAYAIATNRPGFAPSSTSDSATSVNLVAPGYSARITLEARMDASAAYAPGVYDRLEGSRSLTQGNEVVCLAQLSAAQLTGSSVPVFIADGGWLNLAPRCRQVDGASVVTTCSAVAGTTAEIGDSAILYKVETATGYGMVVTPQNQQWFAK